MNGFRIRVEGLEGVPKRRFQIYWTSVIKRIHKLEVDIQPLDWDTMYIKEDFEPHHNLFKFTGHFKDYRNTDSVTKAGEITQKGNIKSVTGYTTFRKYAAIMKYLYKWEVTPLQKTDEQISRLCEEERGGQINESQRAKKHEWISANRKFCFYHSIHAYSLFPQSTRSFLETKRLSRP
jgi:hypothetical protein